jgi:hypothetical protein
MSVTLQEVIARLPELPQEDAEGEEIDHMLFAARVGGEWAAHSPASAVAFSVYAEEEPQGPAGMDYFLEASIAQEVIEAYRQHTGKPRLTHEEAVRAVIYYAVNDAPMPVEQEEERSET